MFMTGKGELVTDPKELGNFIRNIHQYGFQEGMKKCMEITN
jgi:hypothetical protein